MTFRQVFYHLLPGWLGGVAPRGSGAGEADDERVSYSLSFVADAWMQRLLEGVRARFPGKAGPDVLPYLGRDRKIVRGINEPADAWAARQLRWLIDHKVRGNPYALLQQLQAYLQTPVLLRTVDNRGNWFTRNADGSLEALLAQGNWDWDGSPATDWSRFWVLIYAWSAPELVQRDGTWNDGETWGEEGRGTWGCTFTGDQVASIRSIVKAWKPAGTRCPWILVVFDEAASDFDPLNSLSDPGTWGRWGKNVGGTMVAARHDGAIYMNGTSQ